MKPRSEKIYYRISVQDALKWELGKHKTLQSALEDRAVNAIQEANRDIGDNDISGFNISTESGQFVVECVIERAVYAKCRSCGSSCVTRDGLLGWNHISQEYDIVSVLDNADCNNCGDSGNDIMKFTYENGDEVQ